MSAVKQDLLAQAICAAVTSKPLDAILAYAEGMTAGIDPIACGDVEMHVPAEESGPILTAAAERAFELANRARVAFLGGRPDLARSLLLQTRTMHEAIGEALAQWLDEEAAKLAPKGAKPPRAKRITRQDSVRRGYEQMAAADMADMRGVSPASVGVDDNGRNER